MSPKALITLLLVVFMGAAAFLLAYPKFQDVRDLRGERSRLSQNVRAVEAKIASTKNSIAKFEALDEEDFARVGDAFPSELDLPNLLVLVEGLISSSGLIAQDIDVRNASEAGVQRAGASPAATTGGISPRFLTKPAESREYQEAEIVFSILGSYESFKHFLKKAEWSLRIFDVESINFSSPATADKSGTFRFSVIMKTYFSDN